MPFTYETIPLYFVALGSNIIPDYNINVPSFPSTSYMSTSYNPGNMQSTGVYLAGPAGMHHSTTGGSAATHSHVYNQKHESQSVSTYGQQHDFMNGGDNTGQIESSYTSGQSDKGYSGHLDSRYPGTFEPSFTGSNFPGQLDSSFSNKVDSNYPSEGDTSFPGQVNSDFPDRLDSSFSSGQSESNYHGQMDSSYSGHLDTDYSGPKPYLHDSTGVSSTGQASLSSMHGHQEMTVEDASGHDQQQLGEMMAESEEIQVTFGAKTPDNVQSMNSGDKDNNFELDIPRNYYSNLERDYR